MARSHRNEEIDLLTQPGAWEGVQPEFEAPLELGSHLLRTLGQSPWQISPVLETMRHDRYRTLRPPPQVGEK